MTTSTTIYSQFLLRQLPRFRYNFLSIGLLLKKVFPPPGMIQHSTNANKKPKLLFWSERPRSGSFLLLFRCDVRISLVPFYWWDLSPVPSTASACAYLHTDSITLYSMERDWERYRKRCKTRARLLLLTTVPWNRNKRGVQIPVRDVIYLGQAVPDT